MRILSVDAVDLREPGDLVLPGGVFDELVGGQRVGAVLLARLRERAELALHAADVRLIEVEVLDEVDLVAAASPPSRQVGELPECEQVVRLHQGDAVLEVEPLAGLDLFADRSERVERVEDCQRSTSLG